jgi:hypothetical protein
MNLRCKVIFNINIVKFLIIHITINFNENNIKKYGWTLNKKCSCEIMTLFLSWNKNIYICTQSVWHNSVKIKKKKIGHHPMRGLRVRCIETFPIKI